MTSQPSVTSAKLLLTVSLEKTVLSTAAVTNAARCPEVRALQDSVKQLAEQMTTLMDRLHEHTITAAVQHPAPAPVRRYNCNHTGHLSRNWRQPRRQPVCYTCIQLGQEIVSIREMDWGWPLRGPQVVPLMSEGPRLYFYRFK